MTTRFARRTRGTDEQAHRRPRQQDDGRPTTPTASVRPGLLAATGATCLALFVAYFVSTAPEGPADTEVTARSAQSYFVEQGPGLELAATASTAAATLLLVLAALLRRLLRQIQPDSAVGDLALVAGSLLAVEAWVHGAVAGLGDEAADVDPQLALGWYGLQTLMEALGDASLVFRSLLVAAVALAAYRSRYLPRWLTVSGLVVAAVALVGELGGATGWGGFVAAWFIGLFGFLLWLLALGVALLGKARRAARTSRAALAS